MQIAFGNAKVKRRSPRLRHADMAEFNRFRRSVLNAKEAVAASCITACQENEMYRHSVLHCRPNRSRMKKSVIRMSPDNGKRLGQQVRGSLHGFPSLSLSIFPEGTNPDTVQPRGAEVQECPACRSIEKGR